MSIKELDVWRHLGIVAPGVVEASATSGLHSSLSNTQAYASDFSIIASHGWESVREFYSDICLTGLCTTGWLHHCAYHFHKSYSVLDRSSIACSGYCLKYSQSSTATTSHSSPAPAKRQTERIIYFSFFFGRNWLVWPHFFFLQLVARGGRRA